MRRGPLLVALFLAALTLRPQLVGVGPLLPAIKKDLDVTHAVAGLLGTIPVLCMGLFAPPAPYLSSRFGSRFAVAGAVGLVGLAGLARSLVPGAFAVILLTIPVGIGMGLAGAMLPVAVKERFADRPGFATGVYTAGLTLGATFGAATAVPLSHLGGTWRLPLGLIGAVSTVLAVTWLVLSRREPAHVRLDVRPLRLPLRSPLAWRLVAAFFLMSAVFYGLNSWLPDIYVERGWSQSRAGELLAVLNALNVVFGFAVAWIADHWGQRRMWLTGAALLQLLALAGILVIPSAGWVWAALLGIAIGPLFPLTMTMPLDATNHPAEVASLAGMMLGVGYTFSALSPLLLGVIRDATGGFTAVVWTLVAAACALVVVDGSLSPSRLAAGRSAPAIHGST